MSETQAKLVFIATPCFGGLVSQHYMQSVLASSNSGQKPNLARHRRNAHPYRGL
jgi:hypothetical protein